MYYLFTKTITQIPPGPVEDNVQLFISNNSFAWDQQMKLWEKMNVMNNKERQEDKGDRNETEKQVEKLSAKSKVVEQKVEGKSRGKEDF